MKATTPTTTAPAAGRPTGRRKPSAQFFYDEKGRKSHVLLDIKLYEQLLYEVEMAEDVQAYREAKALNEPTIGWEEYQAMMQEEDSAAKKNG